MERRPIIIVNTDNYPTFCDNRCNNTNCSRHISKMRFYTGGCKISKLRDTENCEGYISRRKQALPKCELCGKSCRDRITIKNRVNGNELKVCRGCVKKFDIKQENSNVTDSDTENIENTRKER